MTTESKTHPSFLKGVTTNMFQDITPQSSISETTGASLRANTSNSTSSSVVQYQTDEKDQIVAISASALAIVAAVCVIAFLFWRRKRQQKPTPGLEHCSGNSLTNRSYEMTNGLDNRHSRNSVDGGYAEISQDNLCPKETAENMY